MKLGDFSFDVDDYGNRYVTFAEGVTKTRGKALHKKERKEKPKMFETRVPGKIFLFLKDLISSIVKL